MPKKPRKPATDETKLKASDMMLMPPSTTIRSLAAERRKAIKRSREITGAYGQQVSEAAEKKHVDKKALTYALGLDALSDERLAITLPHLLRYIDDLGLAERANKQSELFEQEGDGGEEGDGGGKVTRIGAAARKVMEQAGANPPGD